MTAFKTFTHHRDETVSSVEVQPTSNEPLNSLASEETLSQTIPAQPLAASSAIAAQPLQPQTFESPVSSHSSPTPAASEAKQTTLATQSPSPTPAVKSQAQDQETALAIQELSSTDAVDIPDIPIRVGIQRKVSRMTVAVSEPGVVTDSKGRVLGSLSSQQSTQAYASRNDGLTFGTITSSQPLWIRPESENGLVFIQDRWYRGAVQLVPEEGALTAVNHLEMQPYLYSVVGAEMYHHWPIEALKAQAIAARSYALVHIVRPASKWYDLGSTQRWQAYKGLDSEAPSPQKAVNTTKGIVISHRGGVVESLYASSEDLVREAHKGFGMSQYGARDLAQQNLDYRQILNRFYPGTTLSLLQGQ